MKMLNAQIVNFKSDFAWKFFSEKFRVPFEKRKFDSFGLLIKTDEPMFLVSHYSLEYFRGENEIFTVGNFNELNEFARELSLEELEVGEFAQNVLLNYESYDDGEMEIAGKRFFLNEPHVMGILNVTPDSFSDGGEFFSKGKALEHAFEMLENGAEIIDVGGESTRPGAEKVNVHEELERVVPVIEEIKSKRPDAIISIDTTKAEVADAALQAGASIVNDINAFESDIKLLDAVKKHNAAYVLMHMKGTPQTMQQNPYYDEPVSEIYDFLKNKINFLTGYGINKIIIDPGIGFGKRIFDNYEIINRLDEFKGLGYPILIGLSRKSFLGNSLGLEVTERDNATVVAETISVMNGARFVRTHNVKNAVQMKTVLNFTNYSETIL